MRKQSGFTLVELLVTIALIAIVAAIAVPNFIGWLPNYRLRAAAHGLFSNFQKAKLTAVKRNTNTAVCFNADGYTIFVDNSATVADQPNFVKDGDEALVAQVNWADYNSVGADPNIMTFDKSSGQPCIAFRPNGIPADHGGGFANGTAFIRNTNGKTTKVVISQAGFIRIE